MNAMQSLARAGRALSMAETQNTNAIPILNLIKLAPFGEWRQVGLLLRKPTPRSGVLPGCMALDAT